MKHEALPIAELLETLELLIAQSQAYERALPPDNYPARAAVTTLGELARQALNEARDIEAQITPSPPPAHPLSPREHQVLTLVAHGLTNREIAYRLGISDRTVQFHINAIFNKTGAQSRTEAVALAFSRRWLEIES